MRVVRGLGSFAFAVVIAVLGIIFVFAAAHVLVLLLEALA